MLSEHKAKRACLYIHEPCVSRIEAGESRRASFRRSAAVRHRSKTASDGDARHSQCCRRRRRCDGRHTSETRVARCCNPIGPIRTGAHLHHHAALTTFMAASCRAPLRRTVSVSTAAKTTNIRLHTHTHTVVVARRRRPLLIRQRLAVQNGKK